MRISQVGETWHIGLTNGKEAEALLEVQSTPVGNKAMQSYDIDYDRIKPAMSAIERLRFAEQVLPEEDVDEAIVFTEPETQHLASLMHGALRRAKELGEPVTSNDALISEMDAQVEAYFDDFDL